MMTGYSFSQVKVWEYGNGSMGMSLVLYDYPIAPPVEVSKGTLTRHSGLKLKAIQRIHKE